MQKTLSIVLLALSLSGCKYPNVELKYLFPEEGTARVFKSPDNEGGEWEDTGKDVPILELQDHFCMSAEDLQKFTRYYQRKCSPVTSEDTSLSL